MSRRNETVDITPDAPRGARHIFGTLRTLYGRRVIEVNNEWYFSEDQNFEAGRRVAGYDDAESTGWIVRHVDSAEREYSDLIRTKREAIELLADWAAEHAVRRRERR